MYLLFWYSRLSQTRSVRMTKDSPSAASLALRSICSAFSRCISRVSDIETREQFYVSYKMARTLPSNPAYFPNRMSECLPKHAVSLCRVIHSVELEGPIIEFGRSEALEYYLN